VCVQLLPFAASLPPTKPCSPLSKADLPPTPPNPPPSVYTHQQTYPYVELPTVLSTLAPRNVGWVYIKK